MSSLPTKPFSTLPPGTLQPLPTPFTLHIEEEKLRDFQTLLKLSPIAKQTFENLQDENGAGHGRFGVTRKWMVETKNYWVEDYDWRNEESHINTFPNFTSTITDSSHSNETFTIHFTALFSTNPSAIPIAFFHGWPGSFLEFLPLLTTLREKYIPSTLPYHIIIPSLPGFTLSSSPPLHQDWKIQDSARIMHKLMLSLGFGSDGYLVQGGDIGSGVAREMAAMYDECRGLHVNFILAKDVQPLAEQGDVLSEVEKKGLDRIKQFQEDGRGYAIEQGTRPATIGLVLASSPVAMLAWIGEKFLAWSDPQSTPPLSTILTDITLYWLTESYPSSIYTYREIRPTPYINKPVGYSYFPYEMAPIPRSWAEKKSRVVFFRAHDNGGHFAALERHEQLWRDVEEWVGIAWGE